MKTKTFNKKLFLNKNTVANLNDSEMKGIKGGETEYPCFTERESLCNPSVCTTICFTQCELCFP